MDIEKLKAAGIDYDIALERFVGKRELYEKYLKKFVDDEHIAAAKEAYQQNDYTELLEQVHALKGMTGTLGIDLLHHVCADIVDSLRTNQYEGLEEKMQNLIEQCEGICEIIKEA